MPNKYCLYRFGGGDQGDEVIIPTPYWVTYSEIVKLAGDPVLVKTKLKNGFKITASELEDAISPGPNYSCFLRHVTQRAPFIPGMN